MKNYSLVHVIRPEKGLTHIRRKGWSEVLNWPQTDEIAITPSLCGKVSASEGHDGRHPSAHSPFSVKVLQGVCPDCVAAYKKQNALTSGRYRTTVSVQYRFQCWSSGKFPSQIRHPSELCGLFEEFGVLWRTDLEDFETFLCGVEAMGSEIALACEPFQRQKPLETQARAIWDLVVTQVVRAVPSYIKARDEEEARFRTAENTIRKLGEFGMDYWPSDDCVDCGTQDGSYERRLLIGFHGAPR